MIQPDAARLDAILATLAPSDAAFLSAVLEPAWKQRARRLGQRDAAIRRALELLAAEPNPPARLAVLMAQLAGQRWGGEGNHLVVEAITAALTLNDGAPLRERQIRHVSQGDRTPVQ